MPSLDNIERLRLQWGPGPNRRPVKVRAARCRARYWPLKRPESRHRPREALKSLIDGVLAREHSEKYVATSTVPTCFFADCLFSALFAKSHKIC